MEADSSDVLMVRIAGNNGDRQGDIIMPWTCVAGPPPPPPGPDFDCSANNADFAETMAGGGRIVTAYGQNIDCRWILTCGDGLAPVVMFERVLYRAGYAVNLYDCDTETCDITTSPARAPASTYYDNYDGTQFAARPAFMVQGVQMEATSSSVLMVRMSGNNGAAQGDIVVPWTCVADGDTPAFPPPPPPPGTPPPAPVFPSPSPPSPPPRCSGTVALTDGGLINDDGTGYSNDADCRWQLTCTNAAERPIVTVYSAALEPVNDIVAVHDGLTIDAPIIEQSWPSTVAAGDQDAEVQKGLCVTSRRRRHATTHTPSRSTYLISTLY
jgi:hypothetical protein